MSDDEYLTPPVREYVAPVALAAICLLLLLTIGFIWGMDWRVFWTACVLAVGAVVVTAAMDHRRREHARVEAEEAQEEAFQAAMKRHPVGRILQPQAGARVEIHKDDPVVRGFNTAGDQTFPPSAHRPPGGLPDIDD